MDKISVLVIFYYVVIRVIVLSVEMNLMELVLTESDNVVS